LNNQLSVDFIPVQLKKEPKLPEHSGKISILFMHILQSLENLDRSLFILINRDFNIPFLDPFMLLLRNPNTWIPLYVFMAFWSYFRLKKKAWLFVLFTLITISLTDSITAFLLKPFFERLRPCQEPSLEGIVRILNGCAGKFSLPSNHAANHFGLATFWFAAIRTLTGQKWQWLWVWAFLISYAQVYIGKHYPGDVLLGGLFGGLVGTLSFRTYQWLSQRTKITDPLRIKGNRIET
jgi:membrane-associated phospholipid phosphatase